MTSRNAKSLVGGLVLVGLGILFLSVNFLHFSMSWWFVLRVVFPTLFVALGLTKLYRHFAWSEEQLHRQAGRASLLGGIFWLGLGTVLLLDIFGYLETLGFIGLYWPVALIVFGVGKVIDFYRLEQNSGIRTAEVFGLVFIAVFGLTSQRLATAHIPLLHDIDWGIPWPIQVSQEEPRFRFDSDEELELESVDVLEIHNLYGNVRVDVASPENETASVRLVKRIRSESRDSAGTVADRVKLVAKQEGKVLSIKTNREELKDLGRRINTDILVKLPDRVGVRIANSFGDIQVAGRAADCSLVNAYGEVIARNIQGTLRIENKYRPVEVKQVDGKVSISTRRSPVRLREIDGDVEVSTDYESVDGRGVSGNVMVRNHHGTITLKDIEGETQVEGSGSRVTVSNIDRKTYIKNSHQPVSANDLRGGLDLETSYTRVRLSGIVGPVDIKAVHSEVQANDVSAGIKLEGRGSKVSLERVDGDLMIATSLRSVSIDGFNGRVSVQNEYGAITLSSSDGLFAPVKAINKNGAITLLVPDKAAFDLSAQSVSGEIESDFGSPPKESEGGATFLETKVGSGGPTVELQTTNSRIQIRRRG